MSVTDAIWLLRRRVVATSLREGGSAAARRFAVQRLTVYEWRRAALAYGEDGLRVRERRPPRMPKAFDFLTERRIAATALAWPTRGCDFFAGVLGQQGHRVSSSGVQKCLRRKGLAHKAERLALLEASSPSRSQALIDRAAKRIQASRPGELVCFDTLRRRARGGGQSRQGLGAHRHRCRDKLGLGAPREPCHPGRACGPARRDRRLARGAWRAP